MTEVTNKDAVIDEEIDRIRWHTSWGLSVFQNLDLLTGYERAEVCLKAIERSLNTIDRERERQTLERLAR